MIKIAFSFLIGFQLMAAQPAPKKTSKTKTNKVTKSVTRPPLKKAGTVQRPALPQSGKAGSATVPGRSAAPVKKVPVNKVQALFQQAQEGFSKQDFYTAANSYYKLAYKSVLLPEERLKARFYLGISLYKLGLKQIAAFPLILVAKEATGDMHKKALDILVGISASLNERQILNYILEKVRTDEISEISQTAFHLIAADKYMADRDYNKALAAAENAIATRDDSLKGLYLKGLVLLKMDRANDALATFEKMYSRLSTKPTTDPLRGLAAISMGRAYYQARRFAEAIEYYRMIPKDHQFYRDSLLEMSWSYFRSARFRSALGTIQTVQTPFYENFWDPESLVLSSIIGLFVCDFANAEYSLKTFDRLYRASYNSLLAAAEANFSLTIAWAELEKAQNHLAKIKKGEEPTYNGNVPFFISRTLLEDPAIKERLVYLDKIQKERDILDKHKAKLPNVYKYAEVILKGRASSAKQQAAQVFKNRLREKLNELADLSNQVDFINYEVLNSKRLVQRVKLDATRFQKDGSDLERQVLIENGYRYWPFEGEYWRDELGNYQYFGENRCAKN